MNDDAAHADRVAAGLLARFGTPQGYDETQNLLSVAYLQGRRDELQRIADGMDETKEAASD